ncbi:MULTISPECIES: hypothetical protein [Marinobacter]|uniref:Transcriptional antiterminator, Rof n=1 Tax=Marinobacter xestospongiae TaxID=994319 RepID=A0ABU3VU94_9GAMM|nr:MULTISPECIES: hypothetical protein [Marinobacter]MDV2077842.1 hypothetical protein [Marinobacter xestospongiae]UDL06468.1 hypothetical protein J2887_06835 [Marinobacter sp. CA1]
MSNHYRPVDCAVHSALRGYLHTGELVELVFRDESGQVLTLHEEIRDLFSRAGEDFLLTSRGRLVRLDHLMMVNGQALST